MRKKFSKKKNTLSCLIKVVNYNRYKDEFKFKSLILMSIFK